MNDPRYATSREAEAAFYSAFERRDLDSMMAVWSEDPNAVCVHPNGPMLIGPAAVRASWEQIFRHAPPMKFGIEDCARTTGRLIAVHVVQEHIRVESGAAPPPVLATNVYRLTDHGWRMVLHHASPAPTHAEPTTLH